MVGLAQGRVGAEICRASSRPSRPGMTRSSSAISNGCPARAASRSAASACVAGGDGDRAHLPGGQLLGEDEAVGRVVVDDEDPPAVQQVRRSRAAGGRRRRRAALELAR